MLVNIFWYKLGLEINVSISKHDIIYLKKKGIFFPPEPEAYHLAMLARASL